MLQPIVLPLELWRGRSGGRERKPIWLWRLSLVSSSGVDVSKRAEGTRVVSGRQIKSMSLWIGCADWSHPPSVGANICHREFVRPPLLFSQARARLEVSCCLDRLAYCGVRCFSRFFARLLQICICKTCSFLPVRDTRRCCCPPPPLVVYVFNVRLVQWCHGAPGVIPMLTKAHEVFEDDR